MGNARVSSDLQRIINDEKMGPKLTRGIFTRGLREFTLESSNGDVYIVRNLQYPFESSSVKNNQPPHFFRKVFDKIYYLISKYSTS